ncbi:MAG: hypothetical protein MRERV_3c002 [Mycoplasmataceae bacterium RV_VA103A]|nr:MAG: hypothetical protein MRERV_3c002 [Mycoplasmataceae bacterium RV_VA103A]
MPTTSLTNITIKKMEDRNFKPYFLVINNDNQDEAFFCFEWTLKSGWQDLVNNYENIKEVEIEFEEKRSSVGDQREDNFKTYRKVVSLYTLNEENIII